jgi:hypothetical protein
MNRYPRPITVSICRPAVRSLVRRRPTCTSTDLDEALVAPDALEQPIARDDAVLVLHEIAEQLELAARQADRRAIDGNRDRLEVGDEPVAAIAAAGAPLAAVGAAPQHGAHAGRELAEAERLGDVVVGAVLETGHAIVFARARGQHDDRDVGAVGARTQDAAHLEPADDRQIEIENDQVGRPVGDRFERRVARRDDARVGVTAPLEGVLDQPGDIWLVFYYQDMRSGHEPSRAYRPKVTPGCRRC